MYIFNKSKDPSIATVKSHQNYIVYNDRTFENCKITCLIHVAFTISPAIATDCCRPRQGNFLASAAFLFNKDSESVENTRNLAKLEKIWKEFKIFEAHKIDHWNKMMTAIEITGIGYLMRELEKIKVLIGIVYRNYKTGKNYRSVVLSKLNLDFRTIFPPPRPPPPPSNVRSNFGTEFLICESYWFAL